MSGIRSRLLAAAETDGRIEVIEPHPRDPNYRRIVVQDRPVAQLTVAETASLELGPGDRWNAKVRARLEQLLRRSAARDAALKVLGRRALSKAALREKLITREHDEAMIDSMLDDLEQEGWLSDVSLAEAVVYDLTRSRPAGARLVRRRLETKGLDADTIDAAVAELEANDDPVESAHAFAEKQFKKMASIDARTAARRLAGQLHRRGFDEDTIEQVIDRLGLTAHDESSTE